MRSGKSRSADHLPSFDTPATYLPSGGGKYRGRFAPSPTGPLHLGSLYTALAGFLQAKSLQGEWLLRIDDIDAPRVVPGSIDSILHTLDRFALHWDGPVAYQSRQHKSYHLALERLAAEGRLYACTCSRKSLTTLNPDRSTFYPGICRHARFDRRQPHALRLKVDETVIEYEDKLQGPYRQDLAREIGDFILLRRDGIVAYHLATVIDDARAGITEVFRGVDLQESTPRQIYLQHQLSLPTPEYLHIPVLVDHRGCKLSKQNGALAVDERNPGSTLFHLLNLLEQSPPDELCEAQPEEILAWAVPAWDASRLTGTDVRIP
ncbi:MAG: tRNA glutamyl-Q(34) synthetase GluQRS [Methylococcaceae bacterium]|nr:tRNA glutamyl-Q(34) synthetase GluQRS [Methylococcaceae bacterium]